MTNEQTAAFFLYEKLHEWKGSETDSLSEQDLAFHLGTYALELDLAGPPNWNKFREAWNELSFNWTQTEEAYVNTGEEHLLEDDEVWATWLDTVTDVLDWN